MFLAIAAYTTTPIANFLFSTPSLPLSPPSTLPHHHITGYRAKYSMALDSPAYITNYQHHSPSFIMPIATLYITSTTTLQVMS